MSSKTVRRGKSIFAIAGVMAIAAFVSCSGSSHSSTTQTPPENPIGANLTLISSDPYSVAPGQHATEVEPHMLANGSMIVAAFQTGRIPGTVEPKGGSTDIGWATSSDGGNTWTHGFLPGLTTGEGTGPYDAASDPNVAYDAKHGVWLISSLPISINSRTPAVMVSSSTDGVHWGSPISVDATAASSDKNWLVCDSFPASPYYGNCYMEWDNPNSFDQILMSTSTDGGQTWSVPLPTADFAQGIGGQPLVQPNGTVVVPIEAFGVSAAVMASFSSSNGGSTWSTLTAISNIQAHTDAGGIRSGPLPSAAVDGAGNIWVVWEDCRFRAGCTTNDLVYSTSTDGATWTPVTRVPIDDTSSTVDHFIPGVGIDPATSGTSAHVGIHYYYYPQTNCSVSTCQLDVGFISSSNGGTSWNTPVTLAGPSLLSWMPDSQNGLMVGDYIATVFTNGTARGVFAVPAPPSGNSTFNEAMYVGQALSVAAAGRQLSSAKDRPLHKLSDKVENERPEKGIRPPRRALRKK